MRNFWAWLNIYLSDNLLVMSIDDLPPHHLITRIPASQMDEQNREIARAIAKDFNGAELSMISVLRGSIPFTNDLLLYMNLFSRRPSLIRTDAFRVESYGEQDESNGDPKILVHLSDPVLNITGKDVILVEDIVDSGHTLFLCALPYILKLNPNSLAIASMLTKNSHRKPIAAHLPLNYFGQDIDYFAVGRGLDWLENYRDGLDISEVVKD